MANDKKYTARWIVGSFRKSEMSFALIWLNSFEADTSTIEIMEIYASSNWLWMFIKVLEEEMA